MKLDTFFPLNMKVDQKNPNSMILVVLIYLAVCAVLKVVDILLGWVPLIGAIIGVLCWVIGLYCAVGIIVAVITYFKKD